MALNAVLIAAIFAAAAYLGRNPPAWLSSWKLSTEMINGGLWSGAVLVSLPLLIATFRKLQALGLLIAELRSARTGETSDAVQAIVARLVPFGGAVLLFLYVFLLGSALLPSAKVAAVLCAQAEEADSAVRKAQGDLPATCQLACRESD